MFKLLGDQTRSRLLFALLEAGELCVCDLAAATGTQEATVSQSLRMLRASGVVTGRREGRLVFYRLADAHVRMLLDLTREHIAHEAVGTPAAQATSTEVIR
jgi:DNA-binding transcriptional ArsR family regulator